MYSHFIVFLTDFGEGSIYVGEMKGVILGINPDAKIINLTHNVKSYDIVQASFLLKKSYTYFPRNSIFLSVIDPEVGSGRLLVAVKTRNYIFVGPDNGLLYPTVNEDKIEISVSIENKTYFLSNSSWTFHGRDILAPVAAYLSKGLAIEKIGPRVEHLQSLEIPNPIIRKDIISCKAIFIDNFGNIVTNIKRSSIVKEITSGLILVELFSNNRCYQIPITNTYSDVGEGKPLALFNSFDCLEIAVNRGNAAGYLKIKEKSELRLKLKETKKT